MACYGNGANRPIGALKEPWRSKQGCNHPTALKLFLRSNRHRLGNRRLFHHSRRSHQMHVRVRRDCPAHLGFDHRCIRQLLPVGPYSPFNGSPRSAIPSLGDLVPGQHLASTVGVGVIGFLFGVFHAVGLLPGITSPVVVSKTGCPSISWAYFQYSMASNAKSPTVNVSPGSTPLES